MMKYIRDLAHNAHLQAGDVEKDVWLRISPFVNAAIYIELCQNDYCTRLVRFFKIEGLIDGIEEHLKTHDKNYTIKAVKAHPVVFEGDWVQKLAEYSVEQFENFRRVTDQYLPKVENIEDESTTPLQVSTSLNWNFLLR